MTLLSELFAVIASLIFIVVLLLSPFHGYVNKSKNKKKILAFLNKKLANPETMTQEMLDNAFDELVRDTSKLNHNSFSLSKYNTKIFTVDGVIGAGKTTFVKKVQQRLKRENAIVLHVREPINNNLFQSLLTKAYQQNKPSNELILKIQLFVLKYFVVRAAFAWKKARQNGKKRKYFPYSVQVIFFDVSYEMEKAFQLNHVELGNLTVSDQAELAMVFNTGLRVLSVLGLAEPQQRYFLNTPLKTCLKHISERQRSGESNITFEYLENLQSNFFKIREKSYTNGLGYSVTPILLDFEPQWTNTVSLYVLPALGFHGHKTKRIDFKKTKKPLIFK